VEQRAHEDDQQRAPARLASWRRGSAIGAVLTTTVAGVRHDPEGADDSEAVVEEHQAEATGDEAIVLYLMPEVPEASLALVRPWLLPSARSTGG